MTATPETALAIAQAGPHRRTDAPWRRLLRNPTAIACLIVLVLVVLAAIAAPWLTSADPNQPDIASTLAPPGPGHLLGADSVGRDVLARLLFGARMSLAGTVLTAVVGFAIGIPTGLIAGYFPGWFDSLASWVSNLLMAIPAIILLLVVLAVFGQSTFLAMSVFGVLMAPGVFRLIRASVTSVREELYVDAARVSGLSDARIIRRHVLRVVIAPTIIQASQMLGVGIAIQAGLEFLGLGSAAQASWGSMLNDAFLSVYRAPLLILWPSLALTVTMVAFALLGNAIRDTLEGTPHASRQARLAARAAQGEARDARRLVAAGAAGADALLQVDGLRVTYPTAHAEGVVVDGVSLRVRRGEVLGLVGESGSGKTQTAFAVLGLLPPQAVVTADAVTFGGTDLLGLGEGRLNALRGNKVAYIPQEPMSNLDPSFTIGAQLVEPMRRHLKISRQEARRRALDLLARVGINDPARVFGLYPHQVSGGMAQRVLIAGAVSCDPDLLIADEPTTALDVTVQAEVLDLLRSLQAEREMGIILVTHNFGVVADLCDTVAVMQHGRIVETAPVEQLFSAPQHPYTQALLASTLEDSPARRPLVGANATDGGHA
ncbi:MAG: dipeptide/oligopeptide/nickel ABC transporter permease/ATP-binding protein [Cellulomonadaceae bacterium]|nr:dipeptide/oligopeptide/nickel ABC transporter permease/ATP-binding protein [Cellulomonadaceae bacterium]